MPRFELFGAAHVTTLALLAGLAIAAVYLARRPPVAMAVRVALGAALVGFVTLHFTELAARRPIRLGDVLPLHLCDMAILLALVALVTRHAATTELLFYWTTTGTLLACVTPALGAGFPTTAYLTYFGLHGGVILAAVSLVLGVGPRPRPGAAVRAWLWTLAYAVGVLLANLALDANYLYLLRKPRGPTLLDHLGPWPIYLGVCAVLALASFVLVDRIARWAWGDRDRTAGTAATEAAEGLAAAPDPAQNR